MIASENIRKFLGIKIIVTFGPRLTTKTAYAKIEKIARKACDAH